MGGRKEGSGWPKRLSGGGRGQGAGEFGSKGEWVEIGNEKLRITHQTMGTRLDWVITSSLVIRVAL